jgi:hypothetical protein
MASAGARTVAAAAVQSALMIGALPLMIVATMVVIAHHNRRGRGRQGYRLHRCVMEMFAVSVDRNGYCLGW